MWVMNVKHHSMEQNHSQAHAKLKRCHYSQSTTISLSSTIYKTIHFYTNNCEYCDINAILLYVFFLIILWGSLSMCDLIMHLFVTAVLLNVCVGSLREY